MGRFKHVSFFLRMAFLVVLMTLWTHFITSLGGWEDAPGIGEKSILAKLSGEKVFLGSCSAAIIYSNPSYFVASNSALIKNLNFDLPGWFCGHRVHAHLPLSIRLLSRPIFWNAPERLKKMGVEVYVRHIKTGDEGATWPSVSGAIHPAAKSRNIAKEIIDSSHQSGLRFIAYYRHIEDKYMSETQPDWVCKDWRERPIESNRGLYMCYNSPYSDFVLKRLIELANMGVDGFYFDQAHMPKTGCWCSFCRKKFKEETGLDHPRSRDLMDPLWHKLVDFNNRTIERTFLKWRKALKRVKKDIVMIISSNTWPSLSDRHTTCRLYEMADSVKTEFALPWTKLKNASHFSLPSGMRALDKDVIIALGYTMARDAASGRPAHVWTHGLKDKLSVLYATSGILTHGCIANLHVSFNIPDPKFQTAFELGKNVSPYLGSSVPYRWSVIHYPEKARDKYATQPDMAWKEVLYPYYGIFRVILRNRMPVSIITDSGLEKGALKGYKVLFLPAPNHINNSMKASLKAFKRAGGLVITQKKNWKWHDPSIDYRRLEKALLKDISYQKLLPEVTVSGGRKVMHSRFYSNGQKQIIITLANDFVWANLKRRRHADLQNGEPPLCSGVRIKIKGQVKNAFEAVNEKELKVWKEKGNFIIEVPTFRYMALIVVNT